MTTKHTPGPWGIAKIDCGAADDEIVAEVGGCIVNICAVFGENAYSMATVDRKNEPHYEVSKDESEANARLIAAAPELLDALQMIAEKTCALEHPMWAAELAQARAAIAKATGS